MAGKLLLKNVGCSAVGFAVGTWISKIRRDREDNALVDAAIELLGEARILVSTVESAATECAVVGGHLRSVIYAASFGMFVCSGCILASLRKGRGGDDDHK